MDGMVTVEAAVVMPLLALVSVTLVWAISVGITQVRVEDAARDAARAIARGDGQQAALAAARRTAGADTQVQIRRSGGLVTVAVSRAARAPGWLLGSLPPIDVRGEAHVEAEDDSAGS